jgi:hypothetical protein
MQSHFYVVYKIDLKMYIDTKLYMSIYLALLFIITPN